MSQPVGEKMNCFQIIKSVLDEEYNQIAGTEDEKDERIKAMLTALMSDYSQLSTESNISYSDRVIKFAYIYKYVTSHANLVYTLLQKNQNLGDIFNSKKLKISCIGGGPGSDFLGIIKYMMTNKKSSNIQFQICDREKTWAESWSGVDDKVEPTFRTSTSYLPLDVTKPDDWKSYTKYFQSDFFTMIYFMSELVAFKDLANNYFNYFFSQAKSGSFFLFVDNNSPEFYSWFDHLARTNNISIIKKQQENIKIPFEEEKSDLGIYFQKFDCPKLQANVAYRIGQKQ